MATLIEELKAFTSVSEQKEQWDQLENHARMLVGGLDLEDFKEACINDELFILNKWQIDRLIELWKSGT